MIKIINAKTLLLAIAIIFSVCCYGQETNKIKILGTWNFDKVEFIIEVDAKDSIDMINESKGVMVTFKEGNKFVTKQKTEDGIKLVESGNYRLTADGKYVLQNGEQVEIVELNDEKLVLKIKDALIMHFKRALNSN